jgi:hypothetical protein
LQKCNILLIYPTDDIKSMVELMVVHVATMYVVVVGQVWWFGILSLMSLFATVGLSAKDAKESVWDPAEYSIFYSQPPSLCLNKFTPQHS